jgi:signal-transduction protein with cAMP-binding, CBS, and nucleotidyltransferase domain
VINNILSSMEVDCVRPGIAVLKAGDEVHHFYMIKKGDVKVFDQGYNYLYSLPEGSFFGEFNILFGLYSDLNYVPTFRND